MNHDENTRLLHEMIPFARLLGFEVTAQEPAEVRLRTTYAEDRCTTGNSLHGGYLMTLADTCGAMCAFLNLPEGATGTATIEGKTNFFRGVREGYVEAVSRPLHTGRTTVVIETDVLDAAGRRVARTTQTQAVFL